MTLVTVPCDLCGGAAFQPVYPNTIAADAADLAAYYSSSRSQAGHLDIVRCSNCGLMMTNPRDDDATLAQVYAGLQDQIYDTEDTNRRRTAQEFFELVAQYCPRPGRLLDVGCATGLFACVAQSAGWQVTGLEASPWAVARARASCPQATFVVGLAEEADLPEESFEAITLWDVLEHVPRPSETLRHLHGWLAPRGWLFLNAPNAKSLVARLMGQHWVLLLREHLWYFSPATIAAMLRQNGFEMAHLRPNFVRFSIANVLARLGQYPGAVGGLSRQLAGQAWLKRLSIQFPMGEMNVVARKM